MATELTKVYRTTDGRLFERDDRDIARKHDAWLELLSWVRCNMPIDDDGDEDTMKLDLEMARKMTSDGDLLPILKRKPQRAE